MPDTLISPASAAKSAGISKSSLRNHTTNPTYATLFSEYARRTPRLFTIDDVRLLRFIGQQTGQGQTHEQVAEAVRAGELDAFDWQPPAQTMPQEAQEAPRAARDHPAAMVLAQAVAGQLEQYRTTATGLTAALFDVSRQLARAEARLKAQEEEIQYLRVQADNSAMIARLQVELSQAQAPRRPWWAFWRRR
jgi:hypothetical protein